MHAFSQSPVLVFLIIMTGDMWKKKKVCVCLCASVHVSVCLCVSTHVCVCACDCLCILKSCTVHLQLITLLQNSN